MNRLRSAGWGSSARELLEGPGVAVAQPAHQSQGVARIAHQEHVVAAGIEELRHQAGRLETWQVREAKVRRVLQAQTLREAAERPRDLAVECLQVAAGHSLRRQAEKAAHPVPIHLDEREVADLLRGLKAVQGQELRLPRSFRGGEEPFGGTDPAEARLLEPQEGGETAAGLSFRVLQRLAPEPLDVPAVAVRQRRTLTADRALLPLLFLLDERPEHAGRGKLASALARRLPIAFALGDPGPGEIQQAFGTLGHQPGVQDAKRRRGRDGPAVEDRLPHRRGDPAHPLDRNPADETIGQPVRNVVALWQKREDHVAVRIGISMHDSRSPGGSDGTADSCRPTRRRSAAPGR